MQEVFYEDKMEFHNCVFKLKDHLFEVEPVELNFEVHSKRGHESLTHLFYDMPVYEHHTSSHKEQIDFLINCNYDFFTPSADQ